MGDIVKFNHPNRFDIPPDKVLKEAMGKMEHVVIAGKGKDGYEYFASSMADGGDVLWYLERCKKHLLQDDEE